MAFSNLPKRLGFFIHPVPLISVVVMALNDHWFKYRFPGLLTGKLSDFCGVFYLPIFLLALLLTIDEVFELQRFRLSTKSAISAIAFTDFLMILVKLSPISAHAIEGFFQSYLFEIRLTSDATDLISFFVNPLTYLYLRSYWTRSKEI